MRRDLALFLAAREQRERAAALAEKAQEKTAVPVNTTEQKKELSQATVQDNDIKKADKAMGGVEESAPAQQTTTSAERDAKSTAEDWTSALPTSSTAAAPPSLIADLFTSTSPSADVKDFDFDSMFEDLTNTSPPNLTADASFDAGGTFDAGQSGGGSGNAEASGDMSDVNDLLQGIEGYGDIPEAGDTAAAQQSAEAAPVHDDTGFDISMLDLPADGKHDGEDIGENTFDELFDLAEFELGDAPVDGDGLDDDWLKELEAS